MDLKLKTRPKSSNCSSILRMKHHSSPTLVSASKLCITDAAGGLVASGAGSKFSR